MHAPQIPDIYDSAKYDAIHNGHLGLPLQELYTTAKVRAAAGAPALARSGGL
jgi:inositol hexakisphosphate/diphosphoinositol-pentakisphosphate kinase